MSSAACSWCGAAEEPLYGPADRPWRICAGCSAAIAAPLTGEPPAQLFRMLDGLTQRQFAVLEAVSQKSGLTQTDLVRATGIDRSTLADLVSRMTTKGLLAREQYRRRYRTLRRRDAHQADPDQPAQQCRQVQRRRRPRRVVPLPVPWLDLEARWHDEHHSRPMGFPASVA